MKNPLKGGAGLASWPALSTPPLGQAGELRDRADAAVAGILFEYVRMPSATCPAPEVKPQR